MSETKEAIIQLGDLLLRKKGYNAFSYADISKELGIKNAAVHYHFPTKSDLVVAIINYHKENFEEFKKATHSKNGIDKVNRFLDIYSKIQKDEKICLVGTLATDWGTIDEESQKHLREMADEILSWLTAVLIEGLKKKDFNFPEAPKTKALLIIGNMLAATQLARITGEKSFNTIRAAVLTSLKA
jgi:AcrR family transcriptional regulator